MRCGGGAVPMTGTAPNHLEWRPSTPEAYHPDSYRAPEAYGYPVMVRPRKAERFTDYSRVRVNLQI